MTGGAHTAALVVFSMTLLAVGGPFLGVSPGLVALLVALGLGALTVDAARFGGRGGHLLAEALPGGLRRLERIAVHEAGHSLVAESDALPVQRVLVGTLACLNAGMACGGSTEFSPPQAPGLSPEDLRRWSRVLQAGMVAEQLVYGDCRGGADDKALLGRLWGVSGSDVETAQREQRRARREVEQLLRKRRLELDAMAQRLLAAAPRLGRAAPADTLARGTEARGTGGDG